MTKQEQRENILEALRYYKRVQDNDFGSYGWLWVSDLQFSVVKAMTGSLSEAKEETRIKRDLVIKHLAEQGYIRISKSGKMFKVLKTK